MSWASLLEETSDMSKVVLAKYISRFDMTCYLVSGVNLAVKAPSSEKSKIRLETSGQRS